MYLEGLGDAGIDTGADYGADELNDAGIDNGMDYGADDLGALKLKLPKIKIGGTVGKVLGKVTKPLAAVATQLIPGGPLVRTAVTAATKKPAPKPVAPPPPKPVAIAPAPKRPVVRAAKPAPKPIAVVKPSPLGPGPKTRAFIPPPKPKGAPTVAGATKAAGAVIEGGKAVRRKTDQAADATRKAAGGLSRFASKAADFAAQAGAAGVPGAAALAQSVAQSADNAAAQLTQNVAPALNVAGAAAEGAGAGAVAGVGFDSIPKPVLYGGIALVVIVGALAMRKAAA